MPDALRAPALGAVLFDPRVEPPPLGVQLILVLAGGSRIVGSWADDCLAWGYLPSLPDSVEDPMGPDGLMILR